MAQRYPNIEFEDRIVDALCMKLVQTPEIFDVLVLPNLYGDIVSDLCAGLVGGLGVAPGANLGEHEAVFEAIHGSVPHRAGTNTGQPHGAAAVGGRDPAAPGRRAGGAARGGCAGGRDRRGNPPAADLGGKTGTQEFADAIIEKLR